jgi:hypothetical protein
MSRVAASYAESAKDRPPDEVDAFLDTLREDVSEDDTERRFKALQGQ